MQRRGRPRSTASIERIGIAGAKHQSSPAYAETGAHPPERPARVISRASWRTDRTWHRGYQRRNGPAGNIATIRRAGIDLACAYPSASTGIGCTAISDNAAHTKAKGIKLEAFGSPVDGLRFSGGLSYIDAKFADDRTIGPLNPANISTPAVAATMR